MCLNKQVRNVELHLKYYLIIAYYEEVHVFVCIYKQSDAERENDINNAVHNICKPSVVFSLFKKEKSSGHWTCFGIAYPINLV